MKKYVYLLQYDESRVIGLELSPSKFCVLMSYY